MNLPRRWWETRWFALAAMLAAAVPLLWPVIPPFTDLPGHIGRYRVMLGDQDALLGQYYAFHWRLVGNLGVDLLVAGLAPWIGLEPAVKGIVLAIPVITTGAILWISREIHGRVSPYALFALPLAYSYPLQFGFVNYCLAMALALVGFALWLRLGRTGRWRVRAVVFVLIGLIVWVAHVMGWAMLCLFAFGAEWARGREAGATPIRAAIRAGFACLPLAPPLLALLVWSGGVPALTERFFEWETKSKGIASMLRDRWAVLDVVSTALLLILIYASLRGRGGRFRAIGAVPAALVGLAFVLLPFMLMGSAYADLRLLPYGLALAILSLAPRDEPGRWNARRVAVAGLAFFLIRTVATTTSLALYDREWSSELAALDAVPRGARVLALSGDTCGQPWAHTRQTHISGMAIARRAAFTNDQWQMAGAPLLTVKLVQAGYFAHDPSQVSVATACAIDPNLMPQQRALRSFPRDIFTHVWLIRPHAGTRLPARLRLRWTNGHSALYAVAREPSRLPPATFTR